MKKLIVEVPNGTVAIHTMFLVQQSRSVCDPPGYSLSFYTAPMVGLDPHTLRVEFGDNGKDLALYFDGISTECLPRSIEATVVEKSIKSPEKQPASESEGV